MNLYTESVLERKSKCKGGGKRRRKKTR